MTSLTYGILRGVVSAHPVGISILRSSLGAECDVHISRVSDSEECGSRSRCHRITKVVNETENWVPVADGAELGVVGAGEFAMVGKLATDVDIGTRLPGCA